MAVAAAVVAVLGLGGALLVSQGRSSAPVESAAPLPEPTTEEPVDADRDPASTATTAQPTSTSEPAPATSGPPPAPQARFDYFDGDVRVDPIGPGRVVAFSPDDTAIIVLDDAPGVAPGCEGAELLALFVQDLATGVRRPAIDGGATVETGGLELLVDPLGATPGEVGTRPVYGREWCDGEPSAPWKGTMAADGRISMVERYPAGGADDPFAGRTLGGGDGFAVAAPDGSHALVITGSTAEVVRLDPDGGDSDAPDTDGRVVASLPDEGASFGAWSPDGGAVALIAEESLLLWSPWTGASQRFDAGPVTDLVFDTTGGRLAVVSWRDQTVSTVLTFGDGPELVPAPARCSGRIPFEKLTAAGLAERGLPGPVVDTVLAIDAAASDCDWAALERLAPDGFVASLGGAESPGAFWDRQETEGSSPMWYLRTLFRQPHVVVDTDADGEGDDFFWPAIQQDDDCELDEAERASAIALGLDPDETEAGCLVVGGYAGYRTSIEDTGGWRVFVAGE